MEAILFPTDMNHHHTYGLVSYLMIDDGLYPSAHNRRDPYALPAFDIRGQWVYPSRYNEYMAPQLPVYMFDGEYLVATGHGDEAAGLPVFEIRCMCMPQLAHGDSGSQQ
ncbi:hypothetical protein J2790_003227 [Paenarthrobacter nicotinovorans]|uniref:Uncharacterized protein n=1 Tax=Paenarthrobacter nicotinovorans TaxID=29320 RepID=A0ABV0GNU8_PAENI|nr:MULTISPECIES: hypothetical protein [Micrococcaceae]MDR6438078.1 hypothetical protein [Paenarthrobacter nicotinovorans]BCW57472.1 hypothetical protein StoSoilB20_08190 [Arthrobacter sp. StoSoilB20]SCZ62259.1 hypothetical protein SAMN02799638_03313 [Arthrobacter sp. UNCCL28]